MKITYTARKVYLRDNFKDRVEKKLAKFFPRTQSQTLLSPLRKTARRLKSLYGTTEWSTAPKAQCPR